MKKAYLIFAAIGALLYIVGSMLHIYKLIGFSIGWSVCLIACLIANFLNKEK